MSCVSVIRNSSLRRAGFLERFGLGSPIRPVAQISVAAADKARRNTSALLRRTSASIGFWMKSTAPASYPRKRRLIIRAARRHENNRDAPRPLVPTHQFRQFETVQARHLHVD